MVICFKCTDETKKNLDLLLRTGEYTDYSQIISLAVSSFLAIHDELGDSHYLVIEPKQDEASPKDDATERTEWQSEAEKSVQKISEEKDRRSDFPVRLSQGEELRIPKLFLNDGLESTEKFPDLPRPHQLDVQNLTIDRWIFGQFNKLLPAKANCRALAHLLLGQSNRSLSLAQASDIIAEQACILGDWLSSFDKKYNLARDDALSTAFPTSSDRKGKGRLRYANQFVGNSTRQGDVHGLLKEFGFILRIDGAKPSITLTDQGWQFAKLPNAVFDLTEPQPAPKFTSEEQQFLLNHISTFVPKEDFAYFIILSNIKDGSNTPDLLDQSLVIHAPPKEKRKFTDSFLNSQRSGAISRMTDLGLVERARNGIRVSYLLTPSGEIFLKEAGSRYHR